MTFRLAPIANLPLLLALAACSPGKTASAERGAPPEHSPAQSIHLRSAPPRGLPTRDQAIRICNDFSGFDRKDCMDTVQQLYPLTVAASPLSGEPS